MGFKIVQRDNQFQCKFYDEKRNRINVDKEDSLLLTLRPIN